MALSRFFRGLTRQHASASSQNVQAINIPNNGGLLDAEGAIPSSIWAEIVHLAGIPVRFDHNVAGVTNTIGLWPLDGGTIPTQTGTSININLHANATPAKGMLVVPRVGNALGQWRWIESVTGADCTLDRAWVGTPPAAGDTVELVIPAIGAQIAYVKSEFEADNKSIDIVLAWYDMALDQEGVERAPIVFYDSAQIVSTVGTASVAGTTFGAQQAGYWQGETLRREAYGGFGFKVHTLSQPAGGSRFSLWAGCT